jgi:hypothetical protein
VAELGAAFLCADLGIAIEPREDHASLAEHPSRGQAGDLRRRGARAAGCGLPSRAAVAAFIRSSADGYHQPGLALKRVAWRITQLMVASSVAGGQRQPRDPNAAPGACCRACHGFAGGVPRLQPHIEVALRAFRLGLFCLDPPAVGERASQKSSLRLLWLGAGQRVGGGWSPVTVTAQMNARSSVAPFGNARAGRRSRSW